jgi:hypothetical protein
VTDGPVSITLDHGTVVVYEQGGDLSDAAQFVRGLNVDELKAEALRNAGLGGVDLISTVVELVAQRLESG